MFAARAFTLETNHTASRIIMENGHLSLLSNNVQSFPGIKEGCKFSWSSSLCFPFQWEYFPQAHTMTTTLLCCALLESCHAKQNESRVRVNQTSTQQSIAWCLWRACTKNQVTLNIISKYCSKATSTIKVLHRTLVTQQLQGRVYS